MPLFGACRKKVRGGEGGWRCDTFYARLWWTINPATVSTPGDEGVQNLWNLFIPWQDVLNRRTFSREVEQRHEYGKDTRRSSFWTFAASFCQHQWQCSTSAVIGLLWPSARHSVHLQFSSLGDTTTTKLHDLDPTFYLSTINSSTVGQIKSPLATCHTWQLHSLALRPLRLRKLIQWIPKRGLSQKEDSACQLPPLCVSKLQSLS